MNYKITVLILLTFTSSLRANGLLFGEAVNSGPLSMEGVLQNPARAVEYKEHALSFSMNPNQRSMLTRYPGSPTSESSKFEAITLPIGGGVYRLSRRLSVGIGFPVPGLSAKIQERNIAIPFLGQAPQVDIEADGTLLKLDGFAAYQVSPEFSVGALIGFSNTQFDAAVYDVGDRSSNIQIKGDNTKFYTRVGMRYKLNPKLQLSASALIFESAQDNIDFGIDLNSSNEDQKTDANKTTFLKQANIGLLFKISEQTQIFGDLGYEAPLQGKRFSLADLREEEIDSTMALSAMLGFSYQLNSSLKILGGGSYVPTTVGAGKRNEDPTGYGIFDFNLAGLTGQRVKPYWLVGSGIQYEFAPKSKRMVLRDGAKLVRSEKPKNRAVLSTGFAFEQSSVGIDSDGEQPAAYQFERYYIPISFEWRIW